MINDSQRIAIKTHLTNNYSNTVKQYLDRIDAKNSEGNSYTKGYIRNVFNGQQSNDDIENAFVELVQQEKLKEIRKKKILSIDNE